MTIAILSTDAVTSLFLGAVPVGKLTVGDTSTNTASTACDKE